MNLYADDSGNKMKLSKTVSLTICVIRFKMVKKYHENDNWKSCVFLSINMLLIIYIRMEETSMS